MLDCLIEATPELRTRSVRLITAEGYQAWLKSEPDVVRAWLETTGFRAKPRQLALLPGDDGALVGAVLVLSDPPSIWDGAALQAGLPAGDWRLDTAGDALDHGRLGLGFAFAAYRFDRYRSGEPKALRLALPGDAATRRAALIAEAIHLGRDLVNTPAGDLGPAELAGAVEEVASAHGADVRIVKGDALLEENFPTIHAVGRASDRAPRMIDLTWGNPAAPKVTLVGKGVCFDTGGLDLKSASNMLLMKKDMGGAATTLALAQAVMAANFPVRLRLLIGAVENSVAGNAFRPGDVIRTRKGLTVEVGNTDAEGRLVLADLLTLADEETPDLLIDCATLTGAARVALGPDLPALFTPDDALADDLMAAAGAAEDPLWRLPLHAPYRDMLDSPIADINNIGGGGMAGAITAALFLKDFVGATRSWAHLDIYGWNPSDRPGRPKGGEATALRALFTAIERRCKSA
jgi:leucyl aminopeptidase